MQLIGENICNNLDHIKHALLNVYADDTLIILLFWKLHFILCGDWIKIEVHIK